MPESYDARFIRFLAAVLTPGAVAVWPWLIAFGISQRDIGRWFLDGGALSYTTILIVTVVAGLLLENLGSRLESCLETKVVRKSAWWAYLRSDPTAKVGHAYISSVVTRLKFELAMPFALLAGALGIAVIAFHQAALPRLGASAFLGIAILLAIWLGFEAKASIKLLDQTRQKMLLVPKSSELET